MKLKPRERRERLFRNGRPIIRLLQFHDGDEYHDDIRVAWVAYSKSTCYSVPPGLTQDEFVDFLMNMNNAAPLYMIADFNKSYKGGKGPIMVIQISGNDWKVTPHAQVFPWATPRNVLRCSVSFLHMMKYKNIGVCVVHALKSSVPLFNRCMEYGVLFRSGMIAGGDPRGDEFIYSIRGKRACLHRE
jgi:hypothetical protein